jgi:hypothetical protein
MKPSRTSCHRLALAALVVLATRRVEWATVGTKKKTWRLPYTPLAFDAGVNLSFSGSAAADGDHGPVVSAIVLCAKPAGTTGKCPTP